MRADLLLYNGRIHTMDGGQPHAQAVAIAGNRIIAVGSDAEVRPLSAPGARAVDLAGRAVIPGLIDAHVHFGSFSIDLYQNRVDLVNVPTIAEATARVARAAAGKERGEWILGAGWNKSLWPGGRFPTASDLDAVAPERPVALEDKSHHATWVNSRALELAHISAATPDPAGGQIVRGSHGEPTGILLETAADLVFQVIPEPDVATVVAALREAVTHAQRLGLTGVHDPGNSTILAAYQALQAQGTPGLRALSHIPSGNLKAASELGLRSAFGDEYLRIGGVKIFADGALGPQTAHMLAPYEDTAGNTGIPTHRQEELFEMVRQAHQAGLSVAVHAIGDAANRAVLDAIERSPRLAGNHLPDRIEHVQILHADDVPRLAQLGVVASMQPIHATSDMEMAERHWGRRCELAYAWRSLQQSGASLAFGSDCPVETLDPLAGIHAAVTRRRADGSPGDQGWIPSQRLTVEEALHAYTLGAAHASGETSLKGSLVPGKLADLVVLSHDIFDIEPMGILEAHVEMTVFDGKVVYEP